MTNRAYASVETKPQPVWWSHPYMMIAGIILIAFSMRSALTSVGPLVGFIREDLLLSNSIAGMLTTVPLLAFGFLSPLVPAFGYRFGTERTLFVALLILIAGIFLRSTGFIFTLFAGTAFIGAGIAVCNVLLPGLVKQRFSEKAGLMTSVYTTAMSSLAALASGVSIPLMQGWQMGWQGSLAFWSFMVIVALAVWLPQIGTSGKPVQKTADRSSQKRLWGSMLAWQVTLFMGLQAFLFYCTIAWLPAILQQQGISLSGSGWLLSLVQVISLPASFLAPVLASRMTNQRVMAAAIGLLSLLGFAGLLVGGNGLVLFTSLILLGLSQGASISLALTFIVIRAVHVRQAAELSGMAQSVGYLLAAVGPMFIGFLFDLTHSWTLPLVTLILVSAMLVFAGLGAGRDQTV
jgi:CP family cyanate transporter-like MFS transporter